ncbi:peptide chain release factor N(5)-glutamine methyltransferase [Christensenellaceae bacterium OttesenSCG-928-K19]|nr:peptide chain release factor N(5)-glutamine methyltransferase [Christensenellaceae bacterium OttesenSCG-928-K19]
MGTVREKYAELKETLCFSEEAAAEAMRILQVTQGRPSGQLQLYMEQPCQNEPDINAIVQKRRAGMPLAYAIGSKPFYGYEFSVDKTVLIPRYDSECVVERAITLVKEKQYNTAIDLCCGSGALGIALLLESGIEAVCFSDISANALETARKNAQRLLPKGKYAQCIFSCGDLLEPIAEKADILLCNPPYVSPEEYKGLDAQIQEFEPALALVAQHDGYEFYERLARESSAYLNPGGAVVLEIGSTQAQGVQDLLKTAGFDSIECGFDLAGRPRWVSAMPVN